MKQNKIAIVTDTNSGIFNERANELGVHLVPMPFFIDGELYYEGESITSETFFEKMEASPELDYKTSMPSPGQVVELWTSLLEDYDEIVYIPMSSGLSNSCSVAQNLSADFNGKVHVVDNQRISVTQAQSVQDALVLREQGKSATEIKETLEMQKLDSSIYIMVDNLDFVKRGGRITPAAALLGGFLKIKPVMQIQGDKLDSFAKSRGIKSAKKVMIQALKDDLEGRFASFNDDMVVFISYSSLPQEEIDAWFKEVQQAFPTYTVKQDPLSLSVSCHIGPKSIGIGCARAIR